MTRAFVAISSIPATESRHIMSSISIIGTGNMARLIGAKAVAGGNSVEIIGRDPAKATTLASALGDGAVAGAFGAVPSGDIVLLAVKYAYCVPVVTSTGTRCPGRSLSTFPTTSPPAVRS
jgi:8-hydroxy-5-deazaflavin:NADPH oxidoreductase